MNKTGTNLNDFMTGTSDADDFYGLDGNDTMLGYAGNDTLYGGAGDDVLHAGDGDDKLYGGTGSDMLYGNDGNDFLVGDIGNDILDGGAGQDTLLGGSGNDHYIIRDRNDYVYDSSGTDSGLVYVDFYKVNPDVENWTWAAGVQRLPYWIDALLPGDAPGFLPLLGSARTFQYAFPTSAPSYFSSADRYGFTAFNAQQIAFAKQALAYISTIADIHFVETTNVHGLNTIVFSNNLQSWSSAYAYYPYDEPIGSDVFLDRGTAGNLTPRQGEYAALTLIHELGHAIGLKHTFSHADADGDTGEGPFLPAAEESTQWSVMSYTDRSADYYLRFSAFDIAALQYLYGPSKAKQTDDVHILSASTSNFIWDGGGTDTIDGSHLTQALTLYLDPGYWGYIGTKSSLISSAGQVTVNFGTVIENAKGGQGNDVIVGNAVANQLYGGNGNDRLTGGAGDDLLDGGAGSDTAVYLGARGNFAVTLNAGFHTVTDLLGAEGKDKLLDIESVSFSDLSIVLATAASVGRVFSGTEGKDVLQGGSGDDILSAGSGNDLLYGHAGNDVIDGGEGLDHVVLAGARSNFTLTKGSNGLQVLDGSGAQGRDLLVGVERIRFNDTALAFDIDGNAGQAYRLYQAAFDRAPDLPGLGYWINSLDVGYSLLNVASGFYYSNEFKSLYGAAPSNSELLTRYYQNVLHRAPDKEGFDWWLNVLDKGLASPIRVLVDFSESPENKAQIIGAVQNGIEYTPWVG